MINSPESVGFESLGAFLDTCAEMIFSEQGVKYKNALYLSHYNFLMGQGFAVSEAFLISWFEKQARVIANKLKTSSPYQEYFNNYLNLWSSFKRVIMLVKKLFSNYENNNGSSNMYVSEIALRQFEAVMLLEEQNRIQWAQAFSDRLNEERDSHFFDLRLLKEYIAKVLDLLVFQDYRVLIRQAENVETNYLEFYKTGRPKDNKKRKIQARFDKYLAANFFQRSIQFFDQRVTNWKELELQEIINQLKVCLNYEKQIQQNLVSEALRQEYWDIITKYYVDGSVQYVINNKVDGVQFILIKARNEYPDSLQSVNVLEETYSIYSTSEFSRLKILPVFHKFIIEGAKDILRELPRGIAPIQLIKEQLEQFSKLFVFVSFLGVVVKQCFKNDSKYQNSLEQGIKEVLEATPDITRKLAFFSHIQLRDHLKEQDDNGDLNSFLVSFDKLIDLIPDKHLFFYHYHTFLKERIFRSQIRSTYAEDEILKMFEKKHGGHVLLDLKHLWADYKVSVNIIRPEIMELIKTSLPFSRISEQSGVAIFRRTRNLYEFDLKEQIQMSLPQEVQCVLKIIDEFYSKKNPGKYLVWNLHLGISTLTFKVQSNMFILRVSNIQLCILFFVRQLQTVSKAQLLRVLNISKEILDHQMEELLANQILISSLDDQQMLQLNQDLKKKNNRLNIDLVPKKKSQAERHNEDLKKIQEMEFVTQDRDIKIQSAIVKKMKARKIMSYKEILAEVDTQFSGYMRYTKQDVLRIIDSLIEGEYIARDQYDQAKFLYTPA